MAEKIIECSECGAQGPVNVKNVVIVCPACGNFLQVQDLDDKKDLFDPKSEPEYWDPYEDIMDFE